MTSMSIAGVKIANVPAENNVLQMLVHDLSWFYDDSIILLPDDFTLQRNRLVFAALNNSAQRGVQSFTTTDFIKELKQYGVEYEKIVTQELLTILESDSSYDKTLFHLDVERIKKCSLLRSFESIGMNVDHFVSREFPLSPNNFDNYTREEIVNYFKAQVNGIEDKHQARGSKSAKNAADGIEDLLAQFKLVPEIGAPLDGAIYNYAIRGARYGKFYINSGSSGSGKTRTMVGQACSLAFPYLNAAGNIVVREEYHPVLYVSTEQAPDEIQTLIISYISGVPEDRILESITTEEDDRRLMIAVEIMKKFADNFILEWIPDPSIALVQTKLAKHVYQNNIHYVFYDYIFSSAGLLGEFRDLKIREDVALMMMSNALKECAIEHNIFIQSGTQVNGEAMKGLIRTENVVRGSRAVADKVDVGCVSVKLMPEEKEKIAPLIEMYGYEEPNLVMDIYKNRRGKLTGVKIFRKFDYGTCRMKDLFITDWDFNPVENVHVFEVKASIVNSVEDISND